MINTILSILFIVGVGVFAYLTFILAEHKEELWDNLIFDEDKEG